MTMTQSDEMRAAGRDYDDSTGPCIRHVLNRADFTRPTWTLKLFARGILELAKRLGA
jgi:hypothetical protein